MGNKGEKKTKRNKDREPPEDTSLKKTKMISKKKKEGDADLPSDFYDNESEKQAPACMSPHIPESEHVALISEIESLVEIKNEHESIKAMRNEIKGEYDFHLSQYEDRKKKYEEHEVLFERSMKQVFNIQKHMIEAQSIKFVQLYENPLTFKQAKSFQQFYDHLHYLTKIFKICDYRDPTSKITLSSISQVEIKKSDLPMPIRNIVTDHFRDFPWILTDKDSLELIFALLQRHQPIQDEKQPALFTATPLFIKRSNFSFSIESKTIHIVTSFFFQSSISSMRIVDRMTQLLETHLNTPIEAQLVRDLIWKGVGSVKFIAYPSEDQHWRGLCHNEKIYVNSYGIESSFSGAPGILISYGVLVLIRQIANFVCRSISSPERKQQLEIPQIFSQYSSKKDFGSILEKQITGKYFISASERDAEICLKANPDQLHNLGSTDDGLCYFFREYESQKKEKTLNVIEKLLNFPLSPTQRESQANKEIGLPIEKKEVSYQFEKMGMDEEMHNEQ